MTVSTDRQEDSRKTRVRRRYEKITAVLGQLFDSYEREQENWQALALLELWRQAVVILREQVEDSNNRKITWAQTSISIRYDVDLDWDALEAGHLKLLYDTFHPEDLGPGLSERLTRIFLKHPLMMLLSEATSNAAWIVDGDTQSPFLPQPIVDEVKAASADHARAIIDRLLRPYVVGGTSLDSTEIEPEGSIRHAGVERLMEFLGDGERIRFVIDIGKRSVGCNIAIMIEPMTIDRPRRRAYYTITTGLAFDNGSAPRLSKKQRRDFWDGLEDFFDDRIDNLRTFDPSFVFTKIEAWNRESDRARRASRDLQAIVRNSARLDRVGRLRFEELIAELYAGMGCRVRLTPAQKDGGFDLVVDHPGPVAFRSYVECKRPDPGNPVGVERVREFLCTVDRGKYKPNKGVMISTTGFTTVAKAQAKNERLRLDLVDRRGLLRMLRTYRPLDMSDSSSST